MSRTKRAKVAVISAYVPLKDNPRPAAEYARRGEMLRDALSDQTAHVFYETVRALWMTPFIEGLARHGHHINHQVFDNPQKNTMEYHAIQHNKLEWLERALPNMPDADTFVWLDFGIMGLPGFNKELLTEFLGRIKENDLAFPGCWDKREINDAYPCWRFCGSLFVVPRQDVFLLNRAFKALTRTYVRAMRSVTWEVNDLARMELMHLGPNIRWYPADHNARMLTEYNW
jgi:hypothetical protein